MISIICPTYNEEKYIEKCIESIISQDYSLSKMELLFIDGRSTDATRNLIEKATIEYPFIRLLDNSHKIVPYAMNIGIDNAIGDIIIRIDAHSSYPSNYVRTLVDGLKKLGADDVGVVCKTDVLHKTPKTLAIREVLSNPFGVGNSLFRIGIDKITEVDTVPFGCYPKEVFEKYGKYDTRLVRNQDIELNKRIKRGGGKIYLLPGTNCTYYARETFKAIMRNNFQNGKWNLLTVYYTDIFKSLSIRHFVPMLFVLSIILPTILSIMYFPLIMISILSLLIYLLLIVSVSINLFIKKNLNLYYVIAGFVSLHLSYGIGSIFGIFTIPFKKK